MGEQFDKANSLNELVAAARSCRRGVTHKDGPMEFCNTVLGSCGRLRRDILSGKYKLRPGTPVEIWRPKHRKATAPWFRDRTWQRSMCNNGVYEDLTRGFIPENMACQKGKGTDLAIRTVISMLQELHREKPGAPVLVVHRDIKKYFPSTPQEKIKEMDRARIRDSAFIPYLEENTDIQEDPRSAEEIRADPFGRRGTGLGSQINQLNQIALLDGLDHEIKAICPHYVRYNDDFLLLSHERERLERANSLIERRTAELGLSLHESSGAQKAGNGFYFLRKKFILKPGGKIVIRLHQAALAEERQLLRKLKQKVDAGERSMADVCRHYQSWIANAEYAGDGPIREMDEFYTMTFRRKPEYKRKRRYLYGDRCDRKKQNPQLGEGERKAPGGEPQAQSRP